MMYILFYLFLDYIGKQKKNYMPKNKFALIVAAHNEEIVIGKLIESLLNQDYPRELFDVFVIADNCTDNTAKIARQYGVNVYERFNKVERVKALH